jgi:hypothetical protein
MGFVLEPGLTNHGIFGRCLKIMGEILVKILGKMKNNTIADFDYSNSNSINIIHKYLN